MDFNCDVTFHQRQNILETPGQKVWRHYVITRGSTSIFFIFLQSVLVKIICSWVKLDMVTPKLSSKNYCEPVKMYLCTFLGCIKVTKDYHP